MKQRSQSTAVQLRSVSTRYQHQLAPAKSGLRDNTSSGRLTARSSLMPPKGATQKNSIPLHKSSHLEAVLFLANEPLSSRKLSQYANLADGTEARTLVTRINERFDKKKYAFRVEQLAGGYQLTTRPQFARWLRRLTHVPGETRLSPPALETLSVIAYRQPIMRAEIEAIRGVSCGEVLAGLLDRDLIRVGGRSDELGRPYLYNTSSRFLQVFGLRSLDDLPRAGIWRKQESEDNADDDIADTATSNSETMEDSEVSLMLAPQDQLESEDTDSNLPVEVVSEPADVRAEDDDDFEEEYDDDEEEDDDEYEYVEEEEDDDESEEDDDEYEYVDEEEDDDEEEEDDDEYEYVDDDEEEDDEYEYVEVDDDESDEDESEEDEWEEVEVDDDEEDEEWDDDDDWDEDDEDDDSLVEADSLDLDDDDEEEEEDDEEDWE